MNIPTPAEMSCPSGPFWAGLQDGQFMLQFDAASKRHLFYPKPLYDAAGAPLPWVPASGQGRLVAYTTSRVPGPGFEGLAPYLLALVKLDEGPRVFAPLKTSGAGDLRIGLRARLLVGGEQVAPYHFELS